MRSLKSLMSASSAASAAQPFGRGLTNNVGQVTPTFACVFKPVKTRICFTKRKNGKARKFNKAAPLVTTFLDKVKKSIRSKQACCKHRCVVTHASNDDYLQQVAQWRRAWHMTPRDQKQAALLAFAAARREKSMMSGESYDVRDVGTSEVGGRQTLVLRPSTVKRHDASYHFLGKHLCSRSFRCFTGVGIHTLGVAGKCAKEGLAKYKQVVRRRYARVRDEMSQAIWMVIQDLHHQSPFAARDVEPDEWYIPFHRKVCLWRLVLKLHQDRDADASKPPLFSKFPRYTEFRRCINKPDFEKVVFHRMVDIGRCPRCEYMEWKCASVPIELRSIWQDALAKHQQLQIAQKRCYAAARAKAATEFPNVQLYTVHDVHEVHEVHHDVHHDVHEVPMMSMMSMKSP